MSNNLTIPVAGTTAKKFGQNTEDYNKYVVIDTKGVLLESGQVVLGFDLLKDGAEAGLRDFLKSLFDTVGFNLELRTGRQEKVVKTVDPKDIMKMIAEGKL